MLSLLGDTLRPRPDHSHQCHLRMAPVSLVPGGCKPTSTVPLEIPASKRAARFIA